MITEKTVFILGAGASMPYGYPSGRQLKNQVIETLRKDSGPGFKRLIDFGYRPSQLKIFRDALFLSGKLSVDALLEHQPELVNIGKSAIAFVLTKLVKIK